MDSSSLSTQVDAFLAPLFPSDGPGGAVLIARDGQVLFRKAYGLANLEWGLPNTPETVFRVGSVTKQFTAVAILMLVEQGKLALDDRIEKFLPDYPTHGHTITVEHLLTHTSGIKSYTSMETWAADWGRDFKLDALINYFKLQPMEFAPGTKWNYNNSAYVLLGAIIEKVSGLPYDRFLKEHIFDPLGMKDTRLELPQALIPRKAYGYDKTPAGYVPSPYISMTQPLAAGGMVSTVDDLFCWEAALSGGKLLAAEHLKRAHIPYTLPDGSSTHYGYGWVIHDFEGAQVIEHGGGIHGFVCNVMRLPAQGLFVVVLNNDGSPKNNPGDLTFSLLMLALNRPIPAPQRAAVTDQELAGTEGTYQVWPGHNFRVVREVDILWIISPDQPERPELVPVADGLFTPTDHPLWKMCPVRDADGLVSEWVTTNQYGEPVITFKRVAEEQPA